VLEEEDPPVDDNFEVDLAAVGVVSFPLPLSMGFEELLFESIPIPTPLSLCEEDNQFISTTTTIRNYVRSGARLSPVSSEDHSKIQPAPALLRTLCNTEQSCKSRVVLQKHISNTNNDYVSLVHITTIVSFPFSSQV